MTSLKLQTKHPKYDAYKPSGVPWLGDVPSGWEVRKLKTIARVLNGYAFNSDTYTDVGLPIIRIGDVGQEVNFEKVKRVPEKTRNKVKRFQIQKQDILLALTGATIGKSSIYKSEKEAYLNQRVAIIRSDKYINQGFVHHFISSNIFKECIKIACYGGAQENIGKSDIDNIDFPLPPLAEQAAIAAYLDEKTQLIDEIVAGKEKQIALLKERRASMINHAVTRGLAPHAPTKPSGVPWLGDVPSGWEVRKLKYNSKVRFSSVDKHVYDHEIPVKVCNYTDVYYGENIVDDSQFRKGSCNPAEFKNFKLKLNDVILTKDSESADDIGIPAFIGKHFENCVCGYHLAQITPQGSLDGSYLFRMFQTEWARRYFELNANGVTRFGLGKSKIENFPMLMPPLAEQTAIAAYLDEKTKQIDETIAQVEQSALLMKEYKASLISSVVTGKVRVFNPEK